MKDLLWPAAIGIALYYLTRQKKEPIDTTYVPQTDTALTTEQKRASIIQFGITNPGAMPRKYQLRSALTQLVNSFNEAEVDLMFKYLFEYVANGILTLDPGTQFYADMSALMQKYQIWT